MEIWNVVHEALGDQPQALLARGDVGLCSSVPLLPQGLCFGCSLCLGHSLPQYFLRTVQCPGENPVRLFPGSPLTVCAHSFILSWERLSMRAQTRVSDRCLPSAWLLVGAQQISVESVNEESKCWARDMPVLSSIEI